ncbi:hypothetical protein BDV38DRAFT_284845 [Aspergillus pseudotamarii]|uniref:Uncharacterized protein n=1 Tax=Aspergillus pseudotamarii TaxID=132259 RepID=A0A5N6SLJ8_ASPPS|nr:uncharacterized protein BDV38DRAFT_284845 [Aspergillus pseudotamarii]KAE8135586.1 hypothetical protein BDV38DRAFT_284845 [Aspergillus pseudotamarii]
MKFQLLFSLTSLLTLCEPIPKKRSSDMGSARYETQLAKALQARDEARRAYHSDRSAANLKKLRSGNTDVQRLLATGINGG